RASWVLSTSKLFSYSRTTNQRPAGPEPILTHLIPFSPSVFIVCSTRHYFFPLCGTRHGASKPLAQAGASPRCRKSNHCDPLSMFSTADALSEQRAVVVIP